VCFGGKVSYLHSYCVLVDGLSVGSVAVTCGDKML
jgi:hypothetical protein